MAPYRTRLWLQRVLSAYSSKRNDTAKTRAKERSKNPKLCGLLESQLKSGSETFWIMGASSLGGKRVETLPTVAPTECYGSGGEGQNCTPGKLEKPTSGMISSPSLPVLSLRGTKTPVKRYPCYNYGLSDVYRAARPSGMPGFLSPCLQKGP